MIQIKLTNKSISFPENWNEVKLINFIEFLKWIDSTPKEGFKQDFEQWQHSMKLLSVFSEDEVTDKDIDRIKWSEISVIANKINDFVSTIPTFKSKPGIVIEGVQYGFINNLDDDLTFAERVTLANLQATHTGWDSLPYSLSVICRPATKTFHKERKKEVYILDEFNASDIEFRVQLMKNVPAFEVMGSINFFLSGNKRQVKDLLGLAKSRKKAAQT